MNSLILAKKAISVAIILLIGNKNPYIGIGPSAHSYTGEERMWNISHNIKYIEQISQMMSEADSKHERDDITS